MFLCKVVRLRLKAHKFIDTTPKGCELSVLSLKVFRDLIMWFGPVQHKPAYRWGWMCGRIYDLFWTFRQSGKCFRMRFDTLTHGWSSMDFRAPLWVYEKEWFIGAHKFHSIFFILTYHMALFHSTFPPMISNIERVYRARIIFTEASATMHATDIQEYDVMYCLWP